MTLGRWLIATIVGAGLLAPLALFVQVALAHAGLGVLLPPQIGRIAAIDTFLVSAVGGAAASIAGEIALFAVSRAWLRVALLAGVLIPAPVLGAALPGWLARLGLEPGHAGWLLAGLPMALAMVFLTGFACRHLRVPAAARPPLGALVAAIAIWDAALTTNAGAGPGAAPLASLVLDLMRGAAAGPIGDALALLAAIPAVLTAVLLALVITRTVVPPER